MARDAVPEGGSFVWNTLNREACRSTRVHAWRAWRSDSRYESILSRQSFFFCGTHLCMTYKVLVAEERRAMQDPARLSLSYPPQVSLLACESFGHVYI